MPGGLPVSHVPFFSIMQLRLLFISLFFFFIMTVRAAPGPTRAICSQGRTAASATCCVWYDVLDDLQANVFHGGACNDEAPDALRLSFHDAVGISAQLKKQIKFGGGGANGSIIAFSGIELAYASNVGLDSIVAAERAVADAHNVSYGDIVQFAAAVGVRNCQGGPRIPFMAGRPSAAKAAPDFLVPEPFDSVTTILARVNDAGLTGPELIALLASHSIGVQEDVDKSIPGTGFGLTPTVFDTKFYNDTFSQKGNAIPGDAIHKGQVMSPTMGQFRLQSDAALAHDPRTVVAWVALSINQQLMALRFAAAMAKMALLGQNARALTDCSEIIPK
ncbi:putative peroxidase [Mycena vitilis]|nr:putative peroxidase [Mycena vitilis]